MSMTNLVAFSKAAREAGMTYGQYMALRYSPPPPPKRRIPAHLRAYVRCCVLCGAPMTFKNARKYCAACRPPSTGSGAATASTSERR